MKLCLLLFMKIAAIVLLLLYPTMVFCVPDYIVTNYNSKNGMPQNSVRSMVFDDRGFLWMTTESGLVRFDGNGFITYNAVTNPSFGGNRIDHLFKTVKGELFFNVSSVTTLFGIKDSIYTIHGHAKKPSGFFVIHDLASLDQYQALVNKAADDNTKSGYFYHNKIISLPISETEYITADKKAFYDYKNGTVVKTIPFGNIIPHEIGMLHGKVLFFDQNRSLYEVDFASGKIVPITLKGPLAAGNFSFRQTQSENIFCNFPYQNLFVTSGQTLYEIVGTNDPLVYHSVAVINNLPANAIINSILYDKQKLQFFIGTNSRGLYIYKKPEMKTLMVELSSGEYPNNVYYNQFSIDKNTVFAAPDKEFTIDGIVKKSTQFSVSHALSIFCKTKDGSIYYFGDSLLYHKKTYAAPAQQIAKLPALVFSMVESAAGEIVLGTQEGIYFIENDSVKTFYTFATRQSNQGERLLVETDKIWYGTFKGLYSIDRKTKVLDTIDILKNEYIRSVQRIQNILFVTTYGNGIFMCRNSNEWIKIPTDANKALLYAHCIINTSKNVLWIPTNKGIFTTRLNQMIKLFDNSSEEIYYFYYGEKNGIINQEFNYGLPNGYLNVGNGYISIPSIEGLVWFNPNSFLLQLPVEKVYIDQLLQDYHTNIVVSDSITLPHNFQNLDVVFSTPYFGNEANVWLSYQLVGYHKDIVKLDAGDRRISLGSLPSGFYTLRIIKRIGFNDSDVTTIEMVIEVQKAWFETGWFILLGVFASLLLVILFFSLLHQLSQRRNEKLEDLVAQKTNELNHVNKELVNNLEKLSASEKQLNQNLKMKDKLIAVMSHDLITPLKYIGIITKMARDEMGVGNISEASRSMAEIETAAAKLHDSTSNTLTWIKFQSYGATVEKQELAIHFLIEELIDRISGMAYFHKIKIENNIPEDDTIVTAPKLLEIILQNLLDNALKHTSQGSVSFSSVRHEGFYEIIVADTGRGIPEAKLQQFDKFINDKDVTILPQELVTGSNGLGLVIIKELLAALQGSFYMESKEGEYTKVHVLLQQA